MKLYRKELIEFEEQWLAKHPNVENNPTEYIDFLNGLNDIILRHDYEVDDRFVTYSRRDFLRQEFSDYLNEKTYSGRGKYNDAFVDLAEYYTGNTWISMSSVPSGMDFRKVINEDDEYKKEGIICKQEIDIIKEMIEEFRTHLNSLNTDTNNIGYEIPESLKDYVYIYNGNIYAKQKLPRGLETEYKDFINSINNKQ